ncbi:MAG: hypothetical protein KGL48_16325 [Sphingomonadales bacterium]|nr:hypothetical protein [Sphingomonadales bacterium]MDE2568049.1 hypothetical protein [Sphingomonadales bacterium]
MEDDSVTSAWDRVDAALARAEAAARELAHTPRPSAPEEGEFDALRARHDALRKAVATGLREIDEMLAGTSR